MKAKALILAVFLFLVLSLVHPNTNLGALGDDVDYSGVEQDKAEKISEKISAMKVLGPLAPISLSPFFGLTCLSGASMLCEKGVLPENSFLSDNEALNSPLFFVVFLLLTLVTSVPKLLSVSKVFAEITDQLETYAGIITYLIIFMIASAGQSDSANEVVYSAGIFSFTRDTLLMAACVANVIVINTVKYFFELLVLISPVPTIDAIFELANKAVAGFLVAVYIFSPWLAFVIDVIIFLICLVIYRWSMRRIKYLRHILLGPVLWSLREKWSIAQEFRPDAGAKRRLSRHVENIELLIKAFPNQKVGRIKKKEQVYLILAGDLFYVIKLPWFKGPVIENLEKNEFTCEVKTGIVSNSIELHNKEGKTLYRLLFSKIYNQQIDKMKDVLSEKS